MRRIALELTVPYHGADGEVIFQPGHLFDADKPLPDPALVNFTKPVVVGEPDAPAAPPPPPPAPEPAPEPPADAPAPRASRGSRA